MGADPNEEVWGAPLLQHAAMYGYAEIVELLLRHRADVNVKTKKGYTALDCAGLGDGENSIRAAELIRRHGGVCGEPYRYEFLITVRKGEVKKAKELISKGANPSARDVMDQSALYFAAGRGNLEMTKLPKAKKGIPLWT
jgi:ankyrin repeat protein